MTIELALVPQLLDPLGIDDPVLSIRAVSAFTSSRNSSKGRCCCNQFRSSESARAQGRELHHAFRKEHRRRFDSNVSASVCASPPCFCDPSSRGRTPQFAGQIYFTTTFRQSRRGRG